MCPALFPYLYFCLEDMILQTYKVLKLPVWHDLLTSWRGKAAEKAPSSTRLVTPTWARSIFDKLKICTDFFRKKIPHFPLLLPAKRRCGEDLKDNPTPLSSRKKVGDVVAPEKPGWLFDWTAWKWTPEKPASISMLNYLSSAWNKVNTFGN